LSKKWLLISYFDRPNSGLNLEMDLTERVFCPITMR